MTRFAIMRYGNDVAHFPADRCHTSARPTASVPRESHPLIYHHIRGGHHHVNEQRYQDHAPGKSPAAKEDASAQVEVRQDGSQATSG
jgi:hypothetical protein